MDDEETIWINLPKFSERYVSGVEAFIQNAFPKFSVGDEITCPCKNCNNRKWYRADVIYNHLICSGPSTLYANWVYEVSLRSDRDSEDLIDCETNINFGDTLDEMLHRTNGPNDDVKNVFRHVQEGKQPLYPGCAKFSRLSFIVRLYSLKCAHGISESGFGDILGLIREAFPQAHIPLSFNAAKNIIKDLGLDYKKIHACPNNCMLYWGENEKENSCKTCGVSRWNIVEKEGTSNNDPKKLIHKVPKNVMRYFPLKPRLQRMFMCEEFAELMTWHAFGRKNDGKLRHPADSDTWRAMDARYPHFSSETRNIRLGVAADGFNPFRTMNTSHTTWPIILVNYNLPPWLCMRQENLILSTLISGPESPSNNIDVFMQPLISELKELWEEGIETYDSFTSQNFRLRAAVIWTISDFPGYAMLSGWSTKGKLACPVCNYETSSMYLKHSRKICYMNHRKFLDPEHKWRFDKKRFNGEVEMGGCPEILTGSDIEELLSGYINHFGGDPHLRKKRKIDSPFKQKSIFFDLPYWSHNLLRHNLDVMHIEKNICDNIIGTLLNIAHKSKDHVNARYDLQDLGIRKELHPIESGDGTRVEIAAAIFDLTKEEKDIFCAVLKNAKLPHGCASNISRYVHTKERKVSGYKSHDAHFMLHYLLQFAVKKSLKPEVAVPLIRLGAFLRGISAKVIDLSEISRLQKEIIEILCQFETIFPPAFFDVMVHLLVHLCREVQLGGPVNQRCMFGIERYLNKLKSYNRNRSKPEGSIAEGYLADECLIFCSRFLNGNEGATQLRSCPQKQEFPIGTRRNKDGTAVHLEESELKACHQYILFNSASKEIESLIE